MEPKQKLHWKSMIHIGRYINGQPVASRMLKVSGVNELVTSTFRILMRYSRSDDDPTSYYHLSPFLGDHTRSIFSVSCLLLLKFNTNSQSILVAWIRSFHELMNSVLLPRSLTYWYCYQRDYGSQIAKFVYNYGPRGKSFYFDHSIHFEKVYNRYQV